MSTIPSATIILPLEQGNADQLIHHTVQELGKVRWRAEILLVDPNHDPQEPICERITYRPIPKRFSSFAAAMDAAKHPLIGIVEPQTTIDKDQWNLLVKRADQFPIQSAFRQHARFQRTRLKRIERALFWLYCTIVRLVLRTGKTEFHSGTTLLNRDGLDSIWNEIVQGKNEYRERLSITKLIASARLNRIPVAETKIEGEYIETESAGSAKKAIRREIQETTKFWWNQFMFPRTQIELPAKRYKPLEKLAAISVLVLLAAFLMFRSLGFPLFEPDEARNAQLALNALNSGQWMSLTLAEENYWDKPPLQIWAIASSYKMFGVSQFSTRLPIAIASMFTLLATVLLGQRLIGFRAAWLAGFLLLLTSGFVCSSRYVTMDATLTATVTAMLLLGYMAIRGRFKKGYAAAAGLACGLGILVKGPVIVVLCLPPLIMTYWLTLSNQSENQLQPIDEIQGTSSRHRLLWFCVPAFLVAGPWYIATALVHPDFLTYFFWKHHVVRFSSAFNHREPFWYYFVGIFVFMFPASYLIPSLTKFMTSRKPENRLLRTKEHGFLFLSAVWIIGFFSISESKLPTYILPAFPAACLLMGTLLEKKIFSPQSNISSVTNAKGTWLEKTGRRAPFELVFWFAVTAIAIRVVAKTESALVGSLIACTLVLLSLVVLATYYRNRPKVTWACCGAISVLMMSLIAHGLVPAISQSRSIKLAASQLQSTPEFRNAPVVFFGRESYGAELKLDTERVSYFEESDVSSVVEFLNSNPNAIIVASEDPMKVLRRDLPWTISLEECENARHLYTSRPNPNVIANRSESNFR